MIIIIDTILNINISFDEFEAYPHPRFLHRAYLGGGPKYTTDWLILPRSPPSLGIRGF